MRCIAWVGYDYLVSNKREWNNCFIKNTSKKYLKIGYNIVKKTHAPNILVVKGTSSYTIAHKNQSKFRIQNIP